LPTVVCSTSPRIRHLSLELCSFDFSRALSGVNRGLGWGVIIAGPHRGFINLPDPQPGLLVAGFRRSPSPALCFDGGLRMKFYSTFSYPRRLHLCGFFAPLPSFQLPVDALAKWGILFTALPTDHHLPPPRPPPLSFLFSATTLVDEPVQYPVCRIPANPQIFGIVRHIFCPFSCTILPMPFVSANRGGFFLLKRVRGEGRFAFFPRVRYRPFAKDVFWVLFLVSCPGIRIASAICP